MITTEVVKQGRPSKNVLSCALFRMANTYRPFTQYEGDFKKFLGLRDSLKGFETRVYVDKTTVDFVVSATKSYQDVTVIQYDCPDFHEGNGHAGIFGMFMRFLPLFENGLETVWVTDIDIQPNFLNKNFLRLMDEHNCDMMFESMICYSEKRLLKRKIPMIGIRLISRVTFPKQLLTNFLNRVLDGKEDELIHYVNQSNIKKPFHKLMPYGIDESFLNGSLYEAIKRRDLKILVRKTFFISGILLKGFPKTQEEDLALRLIFYATPNKQTIQTVVKFYRKVLPEILEDYPCYKELEDKLDNFKNSLDEIFTIKSQDL